MGIRLPEELSSSTVNGFSRKIRPVVMNLWDFRFLVSFTEEIIDSSDLQ